MNKDLLSPLPLLYIEKNIRVWDNFAAKWEVEATKHPEIPGADKYYQNLANLARAQATDINKILLEEEKKRRT